MADSAQPDGRAGSNKIGYYSDTPKFVPRKLHQAENFVDHLIL